MAVFVVLIHMFTPERLDVLAYDYDGCSVLHKTT